MKPTVAIVGRPNVGKSTLFNRLIGEREAIVHDESGVTRDRHYGESEWNGIQFQVIDTGGYLPDDQDVINTGVREQILLGVEEAHVILFVVDVTTGIDTLDDLVADLLRRRKKPVLLVVNKADNPQRILESSEFYRLGFGDLFPVSSLNGSGTGDLLDEVVKHLPVQEKSEKDDTPKIAFIGRPNAGKSSLVNAFLKENRCIVTDVPGTTRDSIHSLLVMDDKRYILIDTAGLRKKAKVKENVEFYSTLRTERAVRECDVAVLLLDATRGFDDQDKKVLQLAVRFNKGIVLAINKWDLVEDKDTHTLRDFENTIRSEIPQLTYIPIVSISALTGQRIIRLMEVVDEVIRERGREIPTHELNDFIEAVSKERSLPMKRGRSLRIQYATQVKKAPPVFKFFMNHPEELPANYRRFLERRLRDRYSFSGVPITMVFRQK